MVLLLPAWLCLIGQAGFHLLYFGVTRESIYDIVGSPVWGAFPNWEMVFRFTWLYSTIGSWTIALGYFVAAWEVPDRTTAVRRGLLGLLVGLACQIFSWIVVVILNPTDNVEELITDGMVGPFWLSMTIGLAVVPAVWIAAALGRRRFGWFLAGLFVAGLAVWLSWYTAQRGFVGQVQKYGLRYPALQFLLGPDRSQLLPRSQLQMRWFLVQCVLMGLVLVGQLGGRMAAGSAKHPTARHHFPSAPKRLYGLGLVVWLIALVYGSGLPFALADRGLWEGLGYFADQISTSPVYWGNIDMAVNVLIQVPLGFLACGWLWPRWRSRAVGGVFLACASVMLLSVVTALGLEFLQVWLAGRQVSVNDVLCQGVGGLAGLVLWATAGSELDRLLAATSRGRHRSIVPLVWLYLLALAAYELYPYVPHLSSGFLERKLQTGGVSVLYTGVGPGKFAALMVLQLLWYGPLGYLLARIPSRRRLASVALLVGLVSAVFEASKLLLSRRATTLLDVVLAIVAGLLGGWLSRRRTVDRERSAGG
jgi:VanZ family protein